MISILLATYNGEKYLSEQLDSIIAQTYKDWTLYIHDDGSKDKTIDIIKNYTNQYKNIIYIEDNQKHRGPAESFFWLLEHVNSDYYFFADQDDVWIDNKLEISLQTIMKAEDDYGKIPLMAFSDLMVVDQQLKIISSSLWEYTKINKVLKPKYLKCLALVTGCTIVINDAGKRIGLEYKERAIMHDSLLALCISCYGKILPIHQSLILYRQHSSNSVGIKKYNRSIISKFFKIKHLYITNSKYYQFSNSITSIDPIRFILLRIEVFIKARFL